MKLWTLLPLLGFGLALATLLTLVQRIVPAIGRTPRAVRCPIHGGDVLLGVTPAPDGRVEVVACSAFIPPHAVRCDRPCAELVSGGQALRMRS